MSPYCTIIVTIKFELRNNGKELVARSDGRKNVAENRKRRREREREPRVDEFERISRHEGENKEDKADEHGSTGQDITGSTGGIWYLTRR